MKTSISKPAIIFTLIAILTVSGFAHEKGIEAGPNGGRVLKTVEPHLEFFVTKNRNVEITPLGADRKATKLSGQIISVTGGDRSKPTKLEFKVQDGKLVSSNTLPDGNNFPISVSIKATATSKPVYEKFNLNLSPCPECKYLEYACVCDHERADPEKK